MLDISTILKTKMEEDKKSTFIVFLELLQESEESDVHLLQSKPNEETGRRLCRKGNIKSN